jgi:GR25 family glycosyltransferase involved in LPS biosynthesis
MKGYVITLRNSTVSVGCATTAIKSSIQVGNTFDVEKYTAVTPEQVDSLMRQYKLKWTYPWDQPTVDFGSGMLLSPYETADPKKRIACFLSHYQLWEHCVQVNEPIFVFEHDAVFVRKVSTDDLVRSNYKIIGLNNPIGATRKSQVFHQMVQNSPLDIVPVPKIDDDKIPQGLAGNSAYFIKPSGASKLINLCRTYGAWPNDAIMCRQLMPSQLAVVKQYCTNLQAIQSTTTL